MKLGRSIILFVVALFVLFSLTYGSDVVHPDMNFCPRVLKGLCGPCLDSCSFKTCEEEFNSRYKGAQPRSCRCDTTGNTHMCSCWIRCG
ncbi:SCR [Medicago truncatula]|nr:SCR [Medicago truncatula]